MSVGSIRMLPRGGPRGSLRQIPKYLRQIMSKSKTQVGRPIGNVGGGCSGFAAFDLTQKPV
jgi:hypothetical protein